MIRLGERKSEDKILIKIRLTVFNLAEIALQKIILELWQLRPLGRKSKWKLKPLENLHPRSWLLKEKLQ